MLSPHIGELLTAYVDGELSAQQARSIEGLLRRSPEARELVRKLEEDAELLRGLPSKPLNVDLSHRVIRSISERRLHQARRAALAYQSAFPTWVGAAAAASVLFAVFAFSYLYFYTAAQTQRNHVAKGGKAALSKNHPDFEEPDGATVPEGAPDEQPRIPDVAHLPRKITLPRPEVPVIRMEVPPSENPENSVEARPSRQFDTLTEIYKLPIAMSWSLHDLEQKKYKEQLRAELQKEDAHRLEVFTLGNSIAFERVKAAFEEHGIRVLIDELAQFRLKNKGWKTDYLLYVESITPEEFARILEKLGAEDHKAEAILMSLNQNDHQELSRLLGVDPTSLDPPQRHGVDIRKPISQLTAEQLRTAPPRPEPGKTSVKPLTRQALVLSYNPVRPKPTASREIKLFLDGRSERKAGTLQVLFVLREGSGS